MGRFFGISVVTGILMLSLAAGAQAISKPIAVGSNAPALPSTPAVAVDATGTAYVAWLNSPSNTTLTFCKIPVGATGCAPVSLQVPDPSHAEYFDPPSVIVNGSNVFVFEEVLGSEDNNQDGMYEWISTDGGATFSPLADAVSYTGVGDSSGTGPMPVVPLPGGNVGFGAFVADGNPTFQTNTLSAPQNYSVGGYPPEGPPPPFATLNPPGDSYTVGNLGGEIVSQLSGTTGLLGVFQTIEEGPCPSNEGLLFAFASLPATNAALDMSPGPGSPWAPLGLVQCNAESPALTSGPSGLGLLFTNETTNTTEFRDFRAPATFLGAVKVAPGSALQPSLTQDGTGGLYATWLSNGTGLRLAYSDTSGRGWFGPVTLFSEKGGAVGVDGIASATGTNGQGWAVFESNGTEYAQPFDAADALPPQDTHLKLSPKSFSTATGTKVRYLDTEAATTTLKVLLLRKGHKPKAIGHFHHTDHVGPNKFHWSGKLSGHPLASGRYELQATPKLGSLTGKTISIKFTVT